MSGSAQGVVEHVINVRYYHYYNTTLSVYLVSCDTDTNLSVDSVLCYWTAGLTPVPAPERREGGGLDS